MYLIMINYEQLVETRNFICSPVCDDLLSGNYYASLFYVLSASDL